MTTEALWNDVLPQALARLRQGAIAQKLVVSLPEGDR